MKPYFRGIEMYNEALMVKVSYPDKWKAYPSNDGRIKVTNGDGNDSLIYYYASSNDTTYDEIFDLVEQTIKENKDIVLKLQLLKDKVEELKELFSKSSYDELLTLRFEIGETRQKRKYTKRKKEDKIEENVDDVKEAENAVDETQNN